MSASTRVGHLGKLVVAAAIATGGIWTATHGLAGVTWVEVERVLVSVPWPRLSVLAAVWFAGLLVYATVLAGSLPGLGVRRGLLLNLTGSAVSNVMPMGGAAGTALNWRMLRRWGHSHQAFASYFLLTNALDVLSKLLLPPLAVAALVLASAAVPGAVWTLAGVCLAVLAAVLVVVGLTTVGVRRSAPEGAEPGTWTLWWGRVIGVLEEARRQLVGNWERLLPGSAGYVAAQVLLLFLCLRAVGLELPLTVVVMAGAIDRVASLIPLTPAGTGFAEVGTVAWLISTGVDPAAVVAGVLLYRVFLVALEVPVGGGLLTAWAWLCRHTAGRQEVAS